MRGGTPLHIAIQLGQASATELLLAARCNVDLQAKDGFTPLHIAAEHGRASATELLISARCNLDLQDQAGRTALQCAQRQGHAGIATLIRNQKQDPPLLGSRVVINGIVAKPELNGCTGTAVSFDDDKGRYSVELDETSTSFMIKSCNLLPMVSL
jgi:ankyrin repeat protein